MTSMSSRADCVAGMLEWFAGGGHLVSPAVFLDRDGVINEHIAAGYVLQHADFRWLPGVVAALRRVSLIGRPIFVVTNQSCVNRGLLDVETLQSIMSEMVATLHAAGVACGGWLCCPHRPDEGCRCRKPAAAMLERAAAVTGVSLSTSVLFGDSLSDIQAAQRVGMRGVLIERNAPQSLAAAIDTLIGEAA